MDKSSFWFKRTIESLKSSDKKVSNQKKETRLPVAINLQKRMIIGKSHEEGSSSVEKFPPAMDYCERSAKKTYEKEDDEPSPRKKLAFDVEDEQIRSFPDEEEKMRAFDDDIDLAINQHEVVLQSLPTVPVPALQSELQPDLNIDGQKPVEADKRLASDVDVSILIEHPYGSNCMESTANEFFGALESISRTATGGEGS